MGDGTFEDFMRHTQFVLKALADMPVGQQGVMECPKCGGKLTWRRVKHNKHRAGVCETPDCLHFLE